jgi:transposase-like protein
MYYSTEFKIKVVKEFLKGDVSKVFLQRKYNIVGHSTIQKWVEKYHKDKFNNVTFINKIKDDKLKNENCFTIGNVIMSKEQINLLEQMSNKVKELEKEVDRLQKERDNYKYESLILNKLVDVAEKNYNIQIKKNT